MTKVSPVAAGGDFFPAGGGILAASRVAPIDEG